MGFKANFSSSDIAFVTNFNNEEQEHTTNFGSYNTIYDGENGATFYPNVSEEGILSWTNDRELPNPTPRKVKGEDGKGGYTPIKGTDYWTPEDKAEMVNDVISALPKYNGEVVSV